MQYITLVCNNDNGGGGSGGDFGKYWARFGPNLSGPPRDPDYWGPDY